MRLTIIREKFSKNQRSLVKIKDYRAKNRVK
jgi:hypothetical protein